MEFASRRRQSPPQGGAALWRVRFGGAVVAADAAATVRRNRTAPSHARTCRDRPPQHSAAGPPSRAAVGGTEFAGRDCMETLLADLRLGLRMLLKAPAFTAVSLLALALGIGANTVMFSVANTVLLRPLAYRDARELMRVQTVQQDTRTRIGNSPPDFYRLRESNQSFSAVAALYRNPVNLTGGQEPQRVRAIVASAELLPVLGVAPALGRGFSRDDESWGSHRVAILGDGLWHSRFGGDPAIVGRSITLDGQPYTVAGVLSPGFSWLGNEAQLLLPLSFEPGDNLNSHNNYFMAVIGRLRRGVTEERARAELAGIARQIGSEFPESRSLSMDLEPLEDSMVGGVRAAVLVLLGAVGFVLLIACANPPGCSRRAPSPACRSRGTTGASASCSGTGRCPATPTTSRRSSTGWWRETTSARSASGCEGAPSPRRTACAHRRWRSSTRSWLAATSRARTRSGRCSRSTSRGSWFPWRPCRSTTGRSGTRWWGSPTTSATPGSTAPRGRWCTRRSRRGPRDSSACSSPCAPRGIRSRWWRRCASRCGAPTPTRRSRVSRPSRRACRAQSRSLDSRPASSASSRRWPCCSRRSASTGSWPWPRCSGRKRSASAWPWARCGATCSRWSCGRASRSPRPGW